MARSKGELKAVRGYMLYATYRALGALTGRLPPRAGYWLAAQVGWLIYHLMRGLRRTVTNNLRHVLGRDADEAQLQALVRQVCVNIAKGHYELFRLNRLDNDQIRALVKVEGMEHLLQALAEGRGAIVVTAHVGSVDVPEQLGQIAGIPITAPVQHTRPERLFRYALRMRESHGLRLIPSDESMMPLFRALRRGEIVALPIDRDVTHSGRVIPFFDTPARMPDGAVRIAQRTGAPVVPAFVTRLPDNSFLAQLEPPEQFPHTGDREADLLAGMRLLVQRAEQAIAGHPEQWVVASPVWPEEGDC